MLYEFITKRRPITKITTNPISKRNRDRLIVLINCMDVGIATYYGSHIQILATKKEWIKINKALSKFNFIIKLEIPHYV